MVVNKLSDHISLNAVDQGISKLNPKINDLQVARDIFVGMKTLDDSDVKASKLPSIALLVTGVVLTTAAVITLIACTIILCNPVSAPIILAASIIAGLSAAISIIGLPLIYCCSVNLSQIAEDEKKGLMGHQLNNYFYALKAEKKWDNLTAEKNKELYNAAVKDYRVCHNTHEIQISELIKEFNEKIKKAEDDLAPLINQKLMSKLNIVPLDIHDYIANFTLALAAK